MRARDIIAAAGTAGALVNCQATQPSTSLSNVTRNGLTGPAALSLNVNGKWSKCATPQLALPKTQDAGIISVSMTGRSTKPQSVSASPVSTGKSVSGDDSGTTGKQGDPRYIATQRCRETGFWDTAKERCETKQDRIAIAEDWQRRRQVQHGAVLGTLAGIQLFSMAGAVAAGVKLQRLKQEEKRLGMPASRTGGRKKQE